MLEESLEKTCGCGISHELERQTTSLLWSTLCRVVLAGENKTKTVLFSNNTWLMYLITKSCLSEGFILQHFFFFSFFGTYTAQTLSCCFSIWLTGCCLVIFTAN